MTLSIPNGFKPVVSGYAMDDPGGVMRTEVAGGASRYGLDYDRGMQRFTLTFIFDALQFSMWEVFYHLQTKKGAIAFYVPMDSGFGISPHLVNIMPGSYSAARTNGVMMVVTFTAETENQVYQMSASDGVAMLDIYGNYGESSNALLNRIDIFANQDTKALVGI